MRFRKINLEVTVQDKDSAVLINALGAARDRIETYVAVIWSNMTIRPTDEPEDAEEIAAPVSRAR